jgi:hypothetical protein
MVGGCRNGRCVRDRRRDPCKVTEGWWSSTVSPPPQSVSKTITHRVNPLMLIHPCPAAFLRAACLSWCLACCAWHFWAVLGDAAEACHAALMCMGNCTQMLDTPSHLSRMPMTHHESTWTRGEQQQRRYPDLRPRCGKSCERERIDPFDTVQCR